MDETRPRSRRRRGLSADEHALWREAMRSVVPLRADPAETVTGSEAPVAPPDGDVAPAAAPPRTPRPQRREPPPLAPLGRRFKAQLGRGTAPIGPRLDLHGMTEAQANAALRTFLARAQADGATLVLVITGKGARGADGLRNGSAAMDHPGGQEFSVLGGPRPRGVLARLVPLWLSMPEFRPWVVGFDHAGPQHGGTGALYVRVRKRRQAGAG